MKNLQAFHVFLFFIFSYGAAPALAQEMQPHMTTQSPESLFVDISKFPTQMRSSTEVTIGDLHSNSIKFLYFLIREGILELSPTQTESIQRYSQLREIYKTAGFKRTPGTLNKIPNIEAINHFEKIINQSKLKSDAPFFRLLGDETGDRGMNDYFTLVILNKLDEEKASFEILLSNHGVEFIKYYESELFNHRNYYPHFLKGQTRAVENLQTLLKFKETHELREKTKKFIQNSYIPHLKIYSYSTGKNQSISLYTHAPTGLEAIELLAKKLEVSGCEKMYFQKNRLNLTECIDKLNKSFERLKSEKTLAWIIKSEGSLDPDGPFNHVIWNRNRDHLDRRTFLDDNTLLHYIHGHDGKTDISDPKVINLNNGLGKGDHRDIGEYTVIHEVLKEEARKLEIAS